MLNFGRPIVKSTPKGRRVAAETAADRIVHEPGLRHTSRIFKTPLGRIGHDEGVKEHWHSTVKPCADFSVKSAQAPRLCTRLCTGPYQDNLDVVRPARVVAHYAVQNQQQCTLAR